MTDPLPAAPGSRQRALVRFSPLIVAVVVLFASAAILAAQGQREAGTLSIQIATVVPASLVVERWAKVRLPTSLHAMYAAVLLAGPWLGRALTLYDRWEPWDTLVHFYSGIPIALGVVVVLGVAASRQRIVLPPWLEALTVLGVHALVAVLWEAAEFSADLALGSRAQLDNTDTMVDLIVGALGGLLVAAALWLHRTRGWLRVMGHYTGG